MTEQANANADFMDFPDTPEVPEAPPLVPHEKGGKLVDCTFQLGSIALKKSGPSAKKPGWPYLNVVARPQGTMIGREAVYQMVTIPSGEQLALAGLDLAEESNAKMVAAFSKDETDAYEFAVRAVRDFNHAAGALKFKTGLLVAYAAGKEGATEERVLEMLAGVAAARPIFHARVFTRKDTNPATGEESYRPALGWHDPRKPLPQDRAGAR